MKKFIIIGIIAIGLFYLTPFSVDNDLKQPPSDWFFNQRAYPQMRIDQQLYINAVEQAKQMNQFRDNDNWVWEQKGPLNIGGRINDVEMPKDNQEVIYIAAATGGIFKSIDFGNTWNPIFDDASNLSIGDIAIAPSNNEILYVGTGEPNCGGGSVTYDGNGIFRSDDAGENWTHIGLEESRNIGRMVVHPENPEILYVAAMGDLFGDNSNRGVYKTSDGGQNWENILYINDSTGAIDICINPENPDILYAATWERVRRPEYRSYGGDGSDIYKSIDGGENWILLNNGIPTGNNIGRIGISLCEAHPNVIYAIHADKTGYFEGLFRSEDDGESWDNISTNTITNMYSSYGWWFGRVHADPVNPDRAYAIGLDLYETNNAGSSWSQTGGFDMHVDQHSVYIHPNNPNITLAGNDGGLYISSNAGNSWQHMENIPITQFYTCEYDETYPERLYGGTQDNSTMRTYFGIADEWNTIYYGDGFGVLVDPDDNSHIYTESQYGNFVRSINGGNTFSSAMSGISGGDRKNWNMPFVFNPNNPATLYLGTNKLYKSENKAVSWQSISGDLTNGPSSGNQVWGTITTIAVSAVDDNNIYVGTDDGNLWHSGDDGNTWSNIGEDLPNRWVTRIATDPFSDGVVYASFSGYRNNEFLAHIFKSTNYGETWESIAGNLPEAPINDIIIDPENAEVLYVGTDVGVYRKKGDNEWEVLAHGLPNVVVMDLDIHNGTRRLLAGTYGRSMYELSLEDEFIGIETQEEGFNIYPNPVDDIINIEINNNFKIYKIYDLSGKIVLSGNIESSLNLSSLISGVYILELKGNNLKETQRFIIK